MTGYAQVLRTIEGIDYVLEVRSLNNKYFKATFRLPEFATQFEIKLNQLVKERLLRGSIYYNLRIYDKGKLTAPNVNTDLLSQYLHTLKIGLLEEFTENVVIDLAGLLDIPGICEARRYDEDFLEAQWEIIKDLTIEASDLLWQMRLAEGRNIWEDIKRQCELILDIHGRIKELADRSLDEYAQRLKERVDAFLAESGLVVSEGDLVKEIAIIAERSDINEELVRLNSHVRHFFEIAEKVELPGKQLEFLAQEMLREINTIGAKTVDAGIIRLVVEAKGAIDRIREQAANLI